MRWSERLLDRAKLGGGCLVLNGAEIKVQQTIWLLAPFPRLNTLLASLAASLSESLLEIGSTDIWVVSELLLHPLSQLSDACSQVWIRSNTSRVVWTS